MFQTARMRKIKILTLDEYASSIVNNLHERGIVQISDISDRIQQDPELADLLTPSKSTEYAGKLSSLHMRTTGIYDLFGNAMSENQSKKEKLMSFIKPEVPVPKQIDKIDVESIISYAESILDQVEEKTLVIEDNLSNLETERNQLLANKSLAEKLINLDLDLGFLDDTKFTSTTVGRVNVEFASEIKNKLSNLTDELTIFEVDDNNKETTIIIVITLNKFKEDVQSTLRKFNFEKFEFENLEGTPNQFISNVNSKLENIESEVSQIKADLLKVADEWDDEIVVLKEVLENERERNEIFSLFARTKDTVLLDAWVPLKNVDEVKEIVETTSNGCCTFEIEDVGKDDDYVPILQEHKGYFKHFEVLVEMYGPVKYNSIDPTFFIAIVFPFFFGYCLTDAFYGSLFAILGFVLYKGMGKVNKTMKSFGFIVVASGLWAVFLGLLTNGFLGDFFTRIVGVDVLAPITIIEPFVEPAVILIIALAIGLIYTNVGFVVGAINNFRYGEKREAIGSQLVWFVFQAGIIFLIVGYMNPALSMIGMGIGAVLIIISLGMLIYGNGAYGIMDIFGFLGDVLSYARLLALCLSTAGIAMTVNILTNMVNDMVPFVGIIIAIFVFIFGHIVNFLLQILGAFINSLRLHYVEFFSHFFMSGKKKFDAFKAKRTFTKLNN